MIDADDIVVRAESQRRLDVVIILKANSVGVNFKLRGDAFHRSLHYMRRIGGI